MAEPTIIGHLNAATRIIGHLNAATRIYQTAVGEASARDGTGGI